MTVRLLDENGDIVTSGVQFTSGVTEIAQTIQTRLRLFQGEYFRNINDGTPWFQSILDKNTPTANKNAALRNRILRTDGVVQLTSFETDFDITTRKFTVSAGVLTTYGQTSLIESGSL